MPSSLPVAPKAAAYKRYLTSIWHTRWLRAAAVALLWHLSVSAVSGDWYASISSLIWAVFPLGPAGFRAALFWITSLIIFMIPLSTFKIGRRCTPSNWTTIRTLTFHPLTPASVFLWHSISAFWFCQAFVYFSPSLQDLAWVINGGYGSPDRLNERPIYLFAFLQVLGTMHAAWYIVEDKSSMSLPENPPKNKDVKTDNETTLARIFERAPIMARDAGSITTVATLFTMFSYNLLFRKPLWHFILAFAKAFANMARSDAEPPSSFYIGGVVLKAAGIGFLLSITWQLDNLLFEIFMVTAPIKNSLPLSASSKDPNGTLLNGLTRKSDLIKTFAFWELFIISESYPIRRKEIFADIERPNSAPMITLMVNAGIDVINSIESRVTKLDPPPGAPQGSGASSTANGEIQHLPRLLPNAVSAKSSILIPQNPTASNSGLDRVGSYISHEARVLGSSPNPWSPPLQKGKQMAIEYSKPTVQDIQSRAESVQQSPVGKYLLTSPVRLVESIVLGTPTGNATLHVHAIRAVTNLLVASLNEDTYGKAVATVPPTIQAMTKSVFVIEHIVRKHTDGVVTQIDAHNLQEVLSVHQCMKSSLKDLLEKFGSFLRDVGLSIRDLNEAQRAAEDRQFFEILHPAVPGVPPQQERREMKEVGQKGSQENGGQNDTNTTGKGTVRRRSDDGKSGKRQSNTERPGRLFAQLDEGSAIDKAWREKRRSDRGKV